jgi:acetyl-CoA acetyltransferase family protein
LSIGEEHRVKADSIQAIAHASGWGQAANRATQPMQYQTILTPAYADRFITPQPRQNAAVLFGSVAYDVKVDGLAPDVGRAKATLYFDKTGQDQGKVLILDGAARTPFSRPETLKQFNEVDLATVAARASVQAVQLDPKTIDYNTWGCVDQTSPFAKALGHVPRNIGAGDVNSVTVNKQCGSGMIAIKVGADNAGRMENEANMVTLVGGVEKMRPTFVSYGFLTYLKGEGDKLKKKFGQMPMWKQLVYGIPMLAPLLVSPTAWSRKFKGGEAFKDQAFIAKVIKEGTPEFRESLKAVVAGKPYKGDLGCHASMIADPVTKDTMADTVERLLGSSEFLKHWITPEELDQFTLDSHTKARDAWKDGKFNQGSRPEVVPVLDKQGKPVVSIDESVRMTVNPDGSVGELTTSMKEISSRRTPGKPSSFHEEYKYTARHSAPNASGVVTGASAALVTNSETVQRLIKSGQLQSDDPVLGEIVAIAEVSVPPGVMGLGAARAAQAILKATGMQLNQMDRLEVNEAFAGVALTAMRILSQENGMAYDDIYKRTNVNGGAIAIGHPLGGSGTRLTVTLMKELKRENLQYGLASLCIGDGQGIAVIVKNPHYKPSTLPRIIADNLVSLDLERRG